MKGRTTVDERALLIQAPGRRLVAVLAVPAEPLPLGVVIVVGGPQYRVGSHRQFVQLARSLASVGFPVLRFDYGGMGDSEGTVRAFDQVDEDLQAAVDALHGALPTLSSTVLWGLCDGASAAAIYLPRDPRVVGVVLANPWVRSEATQAKTQLRHYYTGRLASVVFWKKLLRGRVGLLRSIRELTGNLARALRRGGSAPAARLSFQDRMADGLEAFEGRVLLLISGVDLTAREFSDFAAQDPRWRALLARPQIVRVEFAEADHTFSRASCKRSVEQETADWLSQLLSAGRPAERAQEGRA